MPDDSARGARRGRDLAQRAVLAGLVVLLAAAALAQGLQVRADGSLQDQRTAATRAAERQAVAIASVSAADVDAGIAAVLAASTGTFHDAYAQQAAALRTSVQDAQVRASAAVLDAGVVRSTSRAAVVAVVVQATVANRTQPTPQPRRYRFELGMARVGGAWRTATLQVIG